MDSVLALHNRSRREILQYMNYFAEYAFWRPRLEYKSSREIHRVCI